MKRTQHRRFEYKALGVALIAVAALVASNGPVALARHDHAAGWAVGGLLVGHALTRMHDRDRERAREPRAYSAAPSAPAAAPAAMTPEQKINQLNKLAAGGYITPEEYKTKKQAILNSM